MNVVVADLMANYIRSGSGNGKTVVMIHGWGDSSNTFRNLAAELDDYNVLCLDLPGFGGSQMPPEPWTTNNYSNFVAEWLKKINVSEVYALVGHSFGGAVVINGLADKNLKAKQLVLVASAGIRTKRRLRKKVINAAAKTARLPLFVLPARIRGKVKRSAYKKLGSDIGLLPQMETTFRRIIKEDIQAKAAQIQQPTLLIYGSQDVQTPVSDGRIFSRLIKKSQLEVVDGADHFVHQTPQAAKLVKQFLRAK